jgi:hypothetical protein
MDVVDGLGWEAWAIAALAGLACMLLVRASSPWREALLRLTVLVAVVAATVGVFRWQADRDLTIERQAIQARQAGLAARALVPGSPLACLDGDAGDAVETACERALFATPESTAAAVSYVAAKLSLLADALSADDGELATTIDGLRRMLELDRYGIAAHVLATRDGCNVEVCPAFGWVADATALKANLKARAFDAYVQRYETAWKNPEPAKPAVASAVPRAGSAPAAAPETPPIQPSFASRYDFPSADSIPAVSIMNKEPPRPPDNTTTPPQPGAQTSQAAPLAHLPVPPRRPQTQGVTPR